jgi:hypothetical protein
MLRYTRTGANTYLLAEENMNAPIYLNNRPTNNNIVVYMRKLRFSTEFLFISDKHLIIIH